MKITYYHAFMETNVSRVVRGKIEIKNGCAEFWSGGRKYAVELEYIVSIEQIE